MNEILKTEEVAELLGCDDTTVEEKARRGILPGIKYGRSWRFPREALLKVLNEQALANKPKSRPAPLAVAVAQKPHGRRKPLPTLINLP